MLSIDVGSQKFSRCVAWGLFAGVVLAAFVAWGGGLAWDIEALNVYTLFPLFGLLAWSIMWTHYAYGALLVSGPKLKRDPNYKMITGYVVLGLILLHPGLLALAQWNNLDKLPPGSFSAYVGPALKSALILGEIALFTFLGFEIFDRLRHRPIVKRNWIWVSLSQMIAMILIFLHSRKLGGNLQAGWFKYYWLFLGLTLVPCFVLVGLADYRKSKQQ